MTTIRALIAFLLLVITAGQVQAQTFTNGDIVGGGSGVTFPKYNVIRLTIYNGLATGTGCVENGADSSGEEIPALNCGGLTGTTDGYAAFRVKMPSDYKLGSTIDAHLIWTYPTGAGEENEVVWIFGYRITEVENVTGALTTSTYTPTTGATAMTVVRYKIASFAGPNTMTSILSGEIERNGAAVADDYARKAYVIALWLVYESDSIASTGEQTK